MTTAIAVTKELLYTITKVYSDFFVWREYVANT
jgi:hypothetical protein